ncbi:MAG: LysM peptidoglycan-binding domain-containing protein [Desulfovibrio sp.]|jgi:membrane-bound lytic murein transglycosylase D|nr:LysM peptidoglycan-binding domain-containing protein [Desulfovibrio sp.]
MRIFPTLPLLAALLLSACALHKGTGPDKYQADLPEMMDSYTPRDDGRPLSTSELEAFKTISDLDRSVSPEDAQVVELHFKFFVHENRRLVERYLSRGARFLPYARKIFASRGIPEDLAYLFLVESAGNPNAYSRAGAVGLWQFIPGTGRKYGLTQNAWLDERRDPYKSTYAASDYLLKLYNDFEDWPLAAAAYNAGEGKIGKAMSGTGAKNFFELCRLDERLEERARLRPETRDYVPRLIAVAKIMRNLKKLGFDEPSPDMAWDLSPMNLPPGTNLAGLAKHLDIPWSDFTGMNPALRRAASPPAGAATAYVPPDKLTAAVSWVSTPGARSFAGWTEYTVRKGDSLASIAKRHKISVGELKTANGISSLPPKGETLVIPTSGKGAVYEALAPKHAPAPLASPVPPVRAADRQAPQTAAAKDGEQKNRTADQGYSVGPGDTLSGVALRNGTTVAELARLNNLNPKRAIIRVGQRLILPGKSAAAQASAQRAGAPAPAQSAPLTAEAGGAPAKNPAPKSERKDPGEEKSPARTNAKSISVKSGDTLTSIARRHKVSVRALQEANKLEAGATLRIGRKLFIPSFGK